MPCIHNLSELVRLGDAFPPVPLVGVNSSDRVQDLGSSLAYNRNLLTKSGFGSMSL